MFATLQDYLGDYLGPVMVKQSYYAKGYGALFTCAVTRAVDSSRLSTQAFLQALERFVSIRGAPATYMYMPTFENQKSVHYVREAHITSAKREVLLAGVQGPL